jgi:hypothetical protein
LSQSVPRGFARIAHERNLVRLAAIMRRTFELSFKRCDESNVKKFTALLNKAPQTTHFLGAVRLR